MAEEGVVVEVDLGVEADEAAGLGDDQRVDLEEAHVLLDEGLVERGDQLVAGRDLGTGKPEAEGDAAPEMRRVAGRRVDMDGDDLLRCLGGDLLDIHAAGLGGDEGDAAGRTVDQDREIELARDLRAFLDIEPVDGAAGRPGLVGDQRAAKHLLDLGHHLVDRFGEADAALLAGLGLLEPALAAAAGMDLGLHHPDRPAERLGRFLRLADREDGDAFRHRRAEAAEQLLGLVFVDVHGPWSPVRRSYLPSVGKRRTQASIRPSTAFTDLSNMPRSALDRSISMIRSTPLAPITTGTPI